LIEELNKFVEMISDKELKNKLRNFLEDLTKMQIGIPLEESPAGKSKHHAYEGGLVQHTVAVTKLALAICDILEEVYNAEVNKDVVIAGCILHDLMKAPCYAKKENGSYSLSQLGEKLNHLLLVVAELYKREFPINVIHAVAAHHAEHGPISPKTLEALIVHVADHADSRLNGGVLQAAKFLIREATGIEVKRLSYREAFEVVRIKACEGWEGVKRYVEEKLAVESET